jgi:hypothetical protein
VGRAIFDGRDFPVPTIRRQRPHILIALVVDRHDTTSHEKPIPDGTRVSRRRSIDCSSVLPAVVFREVVRRSGIGTIHSVAVCRSSVLRGFDEYCADHSDRSHPRVDVNCDRIHVLLAIRAEVSSLWSAIRNRRQVQLLQSTEACSTFGGLNSVQS